MLYFDFFQNKQIKKKSSSSTLNFWPKSKPDPYVASAPTKFWFSLNFLLTEMSPGSIYKHCKGVSYQTIPESSISLVEPDL